MSSSSTSMSLRNLFSRALQSASKAQALHTMDDETQDLVASSLRDLEVLAQGIDRSGMFSANESFEDLATGHLPYLLVEYAAAEMEGRLLATDRDERMKRLGNSQRHLQLFLHRVHQYGIIPEGEQKLYSKKLAGVKDPWKRRELKIKQYRAEKELRGSLEAIRKRKEQPMGYMDLSDDLDLIASMLLLSSASGEDREEEEEEETLRDVFLLVIRLIWVQAQSHLESMEQELELLEGAPPLEVMKPKAKAHEDATWRLDLPGNMGGSDVRGPLMDSSGRPLRPFTILPASSSSNRSRMQAEVFRPDHRLPTMTMDEYIEEERRRGNIITGGGPQSQHALTRSEQLTVESEIDGTVQSELKTEEKRQEEERWARYTDLHPKGEGNTMNRG